MASPAANAIAGTPRSTGPPRPSSVARLGSSEFCLCSGRDQLKSPPRSGVANPAYSCSKAPARRNGTVRSFHARSLS
jgi:hypothetical protein